jgi:hypothetical protein
MYAAIMQITIYLSMVLAPVLIPGAIHVFYVIRDRRQAYVQSRTVRAPRVAVPAAVPAMA